MFCKKCGSLLMPNAGIMKCTSCDYTQEEGILKDRKKKTKNIEVVNKNEVETKPTVKAECKECGNNQAFTWMLQTRSADEPETIFFKCTKCTHTWRSY